jgi:hypothetical protein
MKVCILYHPESEFSRGIEEFARDFERTRGKKVELMSIETREGAATASLYDIVQYPTVLALSDDGQIQKAWEGPVLPLMDEVSGYLVQ